MTSPYLKAALVQSPQDPMANFMIGAEYAELSIFERALQHLMIAVEQAPDFHIARFQLGLLQLNLNQIESALLLSGYSRKYTRCNGRNLYRFQRYCRFNEFNRAVACYIFEGIW